MVIFRLKSADAAVTLLFVAKFTGWAPRAGAMPSTAVRQWPSPTPESDDGGHRGYKFPGKPVKRPVKARRCAPRKIAGPRDIHGLVRGAVHHLPRRRLLVARSQ